MAAPSALTFFNSFREYLADGTFDLNTNSFKASLHTSTFVPDLNADAVYADINGELATANGYTSGGISLANVVWTRSGASVKFDADDVNIVASGAGLTFRYVVVRAVGTLNGRVDPLVGYLLLDSAPADVNIAAGNTGVIEWNAAGIFTLT